MSRFRLDIRNAFTVLADDEGRNLDSILDAIVLAKAALLTLERSGGPMTQPWIEISDDRGGIVTTVRLDELPN